MKFIIRDYSIMKIGEGRAVPATGDEPEAIYRYFPAGSGKRPIS